MPGIQQRLREARGELEGSTCAQTASALGTKLLELWAMGSLSAVQLQQLAHGAVLDGSNHPELICLAGIGAFGSAPGNCNRDLKRYVLREEEVWVPKPFAVRVPCKDPKSMSPLLIQETCFGLLPHQVLATLCTKRPEDAKCLLGLDDCEAFWSNVSPHDPRWKAKGGHPMKDWAPGWQPHTVPLWLHGDGVEFQDRDSLLTFSFGSILSTTSAMDSSFLICCWPKSVTSKSPDPSKDTWHTLHRVMAWSFQACFLGVHPSQDHDGNAFKPGSMEEQLAGTPLCGSLRFVLWNFLGDQEYLSNVLGLPHWATDKFCWLCDACRSNPEKSWKDFREQPGWSLVDPAAVVESISNNPLLALPFCSEFNVVLDLLHVLDHKGVAAHLLGSCCHLLIFRPQNRTWVAREQALADLWRRIQEIYVEEGTPSRLTNLQMSMIVDVKHPFAEFACLRAVKAAETRYLVPVLARIMDERAQDTVEQHAALACLLLAKFYAQLDCASMLPGEETANEIDQTMVQFLLECTWLEAWAEKEARKLFHIVPKHHMARHLGFQTHWLNPRWGWTYKAESWVGKLSHQAHSCLPGCRTTRVTQPLVEKYSMLLHLRLTRMIFCD